ncbi:circularly permuted type 2 ATP-grasp protein [Deinococcus misasensis]|uniref:circularly permuted type 2 ATP-grasp protein n=1 Tax=Deinococcus misasensis TaxID=392413 RepID=UPI000A02D69D|nr:circularly permuted type 2 ATP-grasp protein [Deinococcus misasensis]
MTAVSFTHQAFNEVYSTPENVRGHYHVLMDQLSKLGVQEFERRAGLSDLSFRNQGITFTVYGDAQGTERTIPFDMLPRIILAQEWDTLERGLKQRVKAINMFLQDLYGPQKILKDRKIPYDLIHSSPNFRREMFGIQVPYGVYTHVVGSDLIRDEQGQYRVLEDNLRCPSGVSYVLANRTAMTRIFPRLFSQYRVRPVQHYTTALLELLRSLSLRHLEEPTIVVLSPGIYNSAYFEHAFLAQQMGVELVEGRDLFVSESKVFMRTTHGRKQVDVIYRRIDDDFLDPAAFRPDSALGVAGLMQAVRAGNVALANAPGAGIADDKAVYPYVPEMIRYYLSEEPILENVQTYSGAKNQDLVYMLEHAHELVFKPVGESGGYGMLIGPQSSKQEVQDYLQKVRANPRNFIAQPTISLSVHPSYYKDTGNFEPCHIDLRPFILVGQETTLIPGGLTRVALKRGSLVVNSSQGGGSKDTWVLEDDDVLYQQNLMETPVNLPEFEEHQPDLALEAIKMAQEAQQQ